MKLDSPKVESDRPWVYTCCVSGALLLGTACSWLVFGPFIHALAAAPPLASPRRTDPLGGVSAAAQRGAPLPATPQESTRAKEQHSANEDLPATRGDALTTTPLPARRPARRRARVVAQQAQPVVLLPRATAHEIQEVPGADPDMDLMDIPSSPLEARALQAAQARRAASLDKMGLMPNEASPDVEARSGTLSVNSRPWALVLIDDQRVGTTPLRSWKLPAGGHQLRLLNPRHKIDRTVSIHIRPNETLTYIDDGGD